MSLHSLAAAVVTLFSILPTAEQTDRTGIYLVEEFKHSRPLLHFFLEDNERSHFGALVTVREAAKAAIAALEKK